MHEDLVKNLSALVDTVKEPAGDPAVTVAVPKWDVMMAYTAIHSLNEKIKDLESQNAHFHRRISQVMDENDRLAQDFYYLLQQVDGLPPHKEGLKVRLPSLFLPSGEDAGGIFGTRYAVLHPERDEAARAALYAYAANTDNAMIRHKILVWLGDQTEDDEPVSRSAVDIIAESLVLREQRLEKDGHLATA